MYSTDNSILHLPYDHAPIDAAPIPAAEVANARASVPATLLSAIDALSSFDSSLARVVPPDNYHVILTPAVPHDSASAAPWPDNGVQFDPRAMKKSVGKDEEFDAEISHDAYQAIRSQLQQNPAQDIYIINGKALHVHLESSYHPRGWEIIDEGLVEQYK